MPSVCHFTCVHSALDNRIFYREAKSLRKAGYRVSIIGIHSKDTTNEGIYIHSIKRMPRWIRPVLWLHISRIIIETNADIYHFHDPELLLIAPLLKRLTNKTFIYDVHELSVDFLAIKDDIPKWLRLILAKLTQGIEPYLANKLDGLIFADEHIEKSFTQIPLPKATLYNYPSRDFLDKAIACTKDKKYNSQTILYLGGIKPSRGINLLIEAFAFVTKSFPNARLILVGPFTPAKYQKVIKTDIQKLKLEHSVMLTGSIPFENVGQFLEQACIGWIPFPDLPKYQKNIPTKLFEYMAYALPIVSSDLLSTKKFIRHGSNGCLVSPNKPEEHAKAIISLLSHPEKAAKMGLSGQELVNKYYTWNDMESTLLTFYNKIFS